MANRSDKIGNLKSIEPPSSLTQALSPKWLTSALGVGRPGLQVVSVDIIEELTTVADKVRIAATCRLADGASSALHLCLKGYFGEAALRRGELGRAEAAFYRDFPRELSINLPQIEYSGINESSGQALVVMEDLIYSGATFVEPLQAVSPDAVAAALEQYALLHATFWNKSHWTDKPWLKPMADSISSLIDPEILSELLAGERADPLPSEMRDALALVRAVECLPSLRRSGGTCLLHGDAHVANSFHRPDGSIGLVDWQLVQIGCWAVDVAYHIGSALSVEDREQHERELVAGYLGRLREHGIDAPDFSVAWDLYEKAFIYGYYLWAITRFVAPQIINAMVERLGLAVAFHDSVRRLQVD